MTITPVFMITPTFAQFRNIMRNILLTLVVGLIYHNSVAKHAFCGHRCKKKVVIIDSGRGTESRRGGKPRGIRLIPKPVEKSCANALREPVFPEG